MASASDISVAVERAVHDALRDVAERIWKQHRICLKSADFAWIDASTQSSNELLLQDIEVRTLTRR